MKNVKNKLIFLLTSATLAAGLTVSASAQSFTYYGTSCPGSGSDWNTILSNAGSSNCLSNSGSCTSPYGSDSSNVLSDSDLKSLLGNLYSNCPSGQVCDSTGGLAETQPDTAGKNQTCPNTAKQDTADKQCAANVQAAADKSSCPTTASKPANCNTGAAVKASSPSEKAVTQTKTAAQTAGTKAAAKPESAIQNSSAPAAASAPTSSGCNTADIQTACNTKVSQASGNTLMQCINSFLNKCGVNLNSLGITLPGCGNTTATVPTSNGTDKPAQQPSTTGNTGTSAPAGGNANTGNQTKPSGSGQSAPGTTPSNQNGSTSSNTQNADKKSFEEQVAALVNEQRAANGLQPLTLSTTLSNVARVKSQDMHDKHYFAHESPTYGSPFDMLKSFGISYRAAGENIAMGYATPEAVMNAWMNSSGHRANILNASYTQIGVGYVADGNYWTQEFTG
ncbi:CAP domain-containing protein [Oscillibacter sp.]|uniref:CAP domain-containing protein n=1 Tax=Oscillibacter sp. TaxID=1945593 RepID=UPI003390A72D